MMKIEDRIARHRRMAEGYRNAYMHQEVQDGETYEEWKFADGAVYSSPYWTGDEEMLLGETAVDAAKCATMEAKALTLTFPDWRPVDCQIWASDDGFVMKNKWAGHTKDGTGMGYYSYTFARTNDAGEITRWETHVDEQFGHFIELAIGVRGPFALSSTDYVDALARCLDKAGVTV